MTDISACGRIVFHIPWCPDCVSLIRARFRDFVFTFVFDDLRVMAKNKDIYPHNDEHSRGKVKIVALLICYYYYNFLLVAISVDSLYLFSISYFAREDAYSMYSHVLRALSFEEQFEAKSIAFASTS